EAIFYDLPGEMPDVAPDGVLKRRHVVLLPLSRSIAAPKDDATALRFWHRVIHRFDGTTEARGLGPGRRLAGEKGLDCGVQIRGELGIRWELEVIDRPAVDQPALRIEEENPRCLWYQPGMGHRPISIMNHWEPQNSFGDSGAQHLRTFVLARGN